MILRTHIDLIDGGSTTMDVQSSVILRIGELMHFHDHGFAYSHRVTDICYQIWYEDEIPNLRGGNDTDIVVVITERVGDS